MECYLALVIRFGLDVFRDTLLEVRRSALRRDERLSWMVKRMYSRPTYGAQRRRHGGRRCGWTMHLHGEVPKSVRREERRKVS